MTRLGAPDSSVESGRKDSKHNLRHYGFSKPSGTGVSSLTFTALLGIFSRVFHSFAVPRRDRHETYHHKSNRNDRTVPTPFADFRQSGGRLLKQLAAPFASILNRTLVGATRIMNDITEFLKAKSVLSEIGKLGSGVVIAVFLLGAVSKILKSDLFEPFMEGSRLARAPILALRWLIGKSIPAIISGLRSLLTNVAVFVDMLAAIEFSSLLLVGGIIAAAVALAVAGYELYGHWDTAKRLHSRSVDSAHKAAARLLKWVDESVRSAIPFASDALVAIKPANRNVPRFSAARAATARGINRARAVEHAATVVRPAPMLRAVRRAAAAAAFATPLMLTAGPASAFATPLISTNDTTRIAAPLAAVRMTQGPIVINYAPNVVIHSEDAADTTALKRRVMEVLERHGRELHQVLAREIVRQQRREFNPVLSHQ